MVFFDLKDKVALITGGVSGLGLQYAREILPKGARGVTLADINCDLGKKAVQELEDTFGKNKAIFVETDVSKYEQFEDAFKQTIRTFSNLDILINNAGIADDGIWKREIEINVNGTLHGILLGLDKYIPKHKSGSEGIIVNTCSVAGISALAAFPVYATTKFAIHGMTLSWGQPEHFERTKVRVVGLCPGKTDTPMINISDNAFLSPEYKKVQGSYMTEPVQRLDQVGPYLTKIIEKAPSGTMWVVEAGEQPYQYELPDRYTMNKVYLENLD